MADMEKDIEKTQEDNTEQEIMEEETKAADGPAADEAEEAAEEAGEDTLDKGSEKKKGKFLKKEKKKDKKDQQIEELNDRLIRNMAEFDNFRKRTEKEKSQMFDAGAGSILEKILPVIDDFERGLAAMAEDEKETSFAKGIEMIYKKLMTTLTELGVSPIEAVGKEFDPTYHNAVMQAPSEAYESGVITQELQKGYMYKEKIIRHSMVIVAE